MDRAGCLNLLRKYLENGPLIFLGSGASMQYGLPSMADLAKEIKGLRPIDSDPGFSTLCTALDEKGLEEAIDSVTLQPKTLNEIRRIVWRTINERDLKCLDENNMAPPQALVHLIKRVLEPTPHKAVIVTTNYDRLAEYAADKAGATTVTGFEGSLLKNLELPSIPVNNKRVRARERVVDIWKVHGSLDWFRAAGETVTAFSFTREIPKDYQPLIVPPGRGKYASTHEEPYRTVIAEADKAFQQAKAYLCIGYGFNDEHIQPKLFEQISIGKPIVILAKTMISACKERFRTMGKNFLIFESEGSTHTKVYSNSEEVMLDGNYWCLDEFLKIW